MHPRILFLLLAATQVLGAPISTIQGDEFGRSVEERSPIDKRGPQDFEEFGSSVDKRRPQDFEDFGSSVDKRGPQDFEEFGSSVD